MSRRRKAKKPVSSPPAPNDGSPLGHLTDAELFREFAREVARRRVSGQVNLDAPSSCSRRRPNAPWERRRSPPPSRRCRRRTPHSEAVPEVRQTRAGEGT